MISWVRRSGGGRPPFAIRRPRLVLALAAALSLALGVLGLGVEGRLSPTSLSIPGTESQRAAGVLREHFGDSAPFAVLLRGPADQLDLQGPELVAVLRQDPKVTTISPWDRGGGLEQLRPKPNQALVLVDFHVPVDEAVTHTVPHLNEALDRQVRPPVHATQSGFASISRAIQDESIDATQRGELIAIPILLVVLLLVFRSPIAAAIPLVFGGITVLTARGLISLLTHLISVDGFALAASSMMGLALGVDYALLMVSRFREELASGADPPAAALTTRRTAGRTTVFAGTTLLIAMLVSVFLLPGSLLVSLAGTVVIVTLCAVAGSWLVGPALLTLVGTEIDRWHIAAPGPHRPSWLLAVDAAMTRPRLVGGFIAACLLFLAAPALALDTGPPSTEQLPRSDPARQDAETISRAIGPGWSSPFILVASTDDGTMTETARLDALRDWERRIAHEPGVEAVIGPGPVAKRTEPLRAFGRSLLGQGGSPEFERLFSDLARARSGIGRLRLGLAEAADGTERLAGGADAARAGAAAVAVGLDQAAAAGAEATSALGSFASGTRQLAAAQQKALLGALAIKFGASDLGTNLRQNPLPRAHRLDDSLTREFNDLPKLQNPASDAEQELRDALSRLQGMTTGQSDPNYPAALDAVRRALAAVSGTDPVTNAPYAPGYGGLPQGLAALRSELRQNSIDADEVAHWMDTIDSGLKRLRATSIRLYEGMKQIKAATKELAGGAAELSDRAQGLSSGLGTLDSGTGALAGGLSTLRGGLGELERALIRGYWRTRPLEGGLRRADATLTTNRRRLRTQSPGLFDSGYFVLSALEGAPEELRQQAGETVDLRHGGQAALIVAIPKYGFNTAGSTRLDHTLQRAAGGLARDAGVKTAVAGGAAQLTDYDRSTTTRIPLVIAMITLVTFLALIAILRALPLAAIAVALNLVTVAAAFGVLVALGRLPEGLPFGGHDFVDAVGAAAIFGVCFGLSIDYAVFLLMRMRERWEEWGDGSPEAHDDAIAYGLERTAGVITGAAAIMAAVFMAYAIAPIATVSQFGIGLTVAVLLDATVIRLILLPILMRLIGPRVWWVPPRLERALPRVAPRV